jgi:tetratricopeptide (TPR) repeat protein
MHPLLRDWGRERVGEGLIPAQTRLGAVLVTFVGDHRTDFREEHETVETELANIVGFVRLAASGTDTDRWSFAIALVQMIAGKGGVLARFAYFSLRLDLALLARHMAERFGDRGLFAEVLLTVGSALADVGRRAEAWQHLQQAHDIFQELGSEAGIASSLIDMGDWSAAEGNDGDARRFYLDGLTRAEALEQPTGVAAAIGQLGALALKSRDLDEADRRYREAMDIYRREDLAEGIAACLHNLADIGEMRGNRERARQINRESLEQELRTGNLRGIAVSLGKLMRLADGPDDLNAIRTALDSLLRRYERSGNVEGTASIRHLQGDFALREGDLDGADGHFEESLRLKRTLGQRRLIAVALGQLGHVKLFRGEVDEAEKLVVESRALYADIAEAEGQARCELQLATIAERRNDTDAARLHLWRALEHWASLRSLDGATQAVMELLRLSGLLPQIEISPPASRNVSAP